VVIYFSGWYLVLLYPAQLAGVVYKGKTNYIPPILQPWSGGAELVGKRAKDTVFDMYQ